MTIGKGKRPRDPNQLATPPEEIETDPVPNFWLTGFVAGTPAILSCCFALQGALPMKDVYEVLRQKELEKSRLENEVEALRE
jgi:hypothetical protein